MDKVVVYENPDGTVGVMRMTPKCQQNIEQHAEDCSMGRSYELVESSTLVGLESTFRNAWRKKSGGGVETSMTEARIIAHGQRRGKRAEDFKLLDIEVSIPDRAVGAEAKRQLVRDADAVFQDQIDGAATSGALHTLLTERSMLDVTGNGLYEHTEFTPF